MATQYFIKREEKVHGPFTVEQIKNGIKSNKLTSKDEVSVLESGSWEPMQVFYNAILNNQVVQGESGSQAPREDPMRTVQQFQLRKNAFGKYTAQYKCPYCNAGLSSGEQEICEGDHCPECHMLFRFSVDAITQIESGRQRIREEKERKSEERRQQKLERQQEQERQQQRREEERRHAEQARLERQMADNAEKRKRKTRPKDKKQRSNRGLLVLVAVVGVVSLAGVAVVALNFGDGGNPVVNLLAGSKVKKVIIEAGKVTITDKEDGISHLKLECNNGLVIDADWERNPFNEFGYDIYEPVVNMDYNRFAVMMMARVVIASYLKGEYD